MTKIILLLFCFFQQIAGTVDEFFERDNLKSFRRLTIFFNGQFEPFERLTNFCERIARTVRTADEVLRTDGSSRSNGC